MKKNIAFPFLILRNGAVDAAHWEYRLNENVFQEAEDPAFIEGWDSPSILALQRTIKVDLRQVAENLALGENDFVLNVVVRVGTGGTGRIPRRIITRKEGKLTVENTEASFEISLPGDELSTAVHLTTAICIASPGSRASDLSPTMVGATVWSDTVRLMLEGAASKFPIEVADFGEWFGAESKKALWRLHWEPGRWDTDVLGALRLIINSRHPELVEKVHALDSLLYRAMAGDVISQVCEQYLKDPDREDRDYEPHTVGAQAQGWLRAMWPQTDEVGWRQILEGDPGKFRAVAASFYDIPESNP